MSESEIEWSQYEAAVGKNWAHYRPRFERFAKGGWISWNWAAFFGTFAWLRFRKLHAWSWAYLFLSTPVLLALPAILIGDICEYELAYGSPAAIKGAFLGALLLGWVVPPAMADRVYFGRMRAIVDTARNESTTGSYWGALALQSVLAIVLFSAATNRVDSAIYRAMVSEGVSLAGMAKTPLAEYMADHGGRQPARIEEVAGNTSGKYVGGLELRPDGTIRAVFGPGGRKLAGRSVSMIPRKTDSANAAWSCRSDDLPNSCLPASCRQE
jgi:type IV pilus assembly protein PilA